jgi:hypothetical protein
MTNQQKRNRLLIVAIFAMSIIPFLIAWVFYQNPGLLSARTNYGQLITPPVVTSRDDFQGFDSFSRENISELAGHWLIANVIPGAHCREVCLDAVLKTRQLRLMLNKDLPRTRRVVLILDQAPAELADQWWLKDALLWRLHRENDKAAQTLFANLLQEEKLLNDQLVAQLLGQENKASAVNSDLIRVIPSAQLRNKLAVLRKGSLPDGMLLLIDPLGNVMMQYEPGFDPYQVKSDLLHLLKISQIG